MCGCKAPLATGFISNKMNTFAHSVHSMKSRSKIITGFIICLLIPLVIGGISGYITSSEINTWFSALRKPSFNPPNTVFGPVWTVLYLLMGISSFLVWKGPETRLRNKALAVYGAQLFLNFWWSIIFFSFHSLLFAVIEIIALWALITYMIVLFGKVSKTAAYLNLPYILWVSFATLLTVAFWWLNS